MITVGIVSRGNPKHLHWLLKSIQLNRSRSWEVMVCVRSKDDLTRYVDHLTLFDSQFKLNIVPDKSDVECFNMMAAHSRKMFLPLPDGVTLRETTLMSAESAMNRHYRDLDGVIGLKNKAQGDAGERDLMMIGARFLRRFPECKPFYPGYRQFAADRELKFFAKRLGRFTYCPYAVIEDMSVCFENDINYIPPYRAMDYRSRDWVLYRNRVRLRAKWGSVRNPLKGRA